MAEVQTSTIVGVRTEKYSKWTIYEGTRGALLAAGLGLQTHLFADGTNTKRDKRGRVCRKCEGLIDGRKVTTTWLRERGKYLVYFHRTPEERERFEGAREESARLQLTRDAMADGGPKGMAQACLDGAGISLLMAFNMTDDPAKPYQFPAKTKAAVKEHLLAIMALFQSGGFEPRTGAIAQADSEFQRFMSLLPKG